MDRPRGEPARPRRPGGPARGGPLAAWALWLAAALPPAAAGELINAIHVRVNGQPVVHQDVQDTANLLVRLRYGGNAPGSRQALVELEAEAVREQVRALLILEEMRKRNIRLEKPDYDRRLRAYRIDPARVSPAVRRWVEAQCVFPEVLKANHILPFQPSPQGIKDYYHRFRDSEFREMGRVRLRRMLVPRQPGEGLEALLERVGGDCRRLEALPFPVRAGEVARFIRERSHDLYAQEGGLVSVDPTQEPGWLRESLDYYATDTRETLFPGPVMAETRALVQARAAGRFTRPVDTEFGCLAVYVEAVEPGRVASFDEVKDYIDQKLADEGQHRKSVQWLRRKFDQSRIAWNSGEPYTLDELLPPHQRGR